MNEIFKNKKANFDKLLRYGFQKVDNIYLYCAQFDALQFLVKICVAQDSAISTQCFDEASGEEYTLYHSKDAVGAFVGRVREEIEKLLVDICDKCFDENIFKNEQTKEIIQLVQNKYGDKLEFLWEKFENDAIWRRKDNNKWYAALLTAKQDSILHNGVKDWIEVIDLRADCDEIDRIVDNKKYFRGYHMNKKHWLTIILDYSVPTDEIMDRIEKSYILAKK